MPHCTEKFLCTSYTIVVVQRPSPWSQLMSPFSLYDHLLTHMTVWNDERDADCDQSVVAVPLLANAGKVQGAVACPNSIQDDT